jgi:hypothetical protein
MTPVVIKVEKLEAARRQMETAISLFFEERDPVAIHTLAAAAYDVIDGINEHRKGNPMFVKRRYTELPGKVDRKTLNDTQNFLKHADKGPERTLDFFPDLSEMLIVDACRTYRDLTGETVPLFEAFSRWVTCRNGESGFNWPKEKQPLLKDLLALFRAGDRRGFLARCLTP